MGARTSHRCGTGGRACVLRRLAAVLALLLALMPALSPALSGDALAGDLAFHGAAGRHAAAVSGSGARTDLARDEAADDPGLASHIHCGCLQFAPLGAPPALVPPTPARPRYASVRQDPASLPPNRPARPPRA